MKKRGALFYIIDAFVAASIIALTMTIIFSTQLNAPKSESAEDALDYYLTYVQKTTIENAPGTLKTTLIDRQLIDDPEDTIISSLAQLVERGNLAEAQLLVQDINQIALETQYGMNMSLLINGARTQLATKNLDRRDGSKVFLQKSVLSTFQFRLTEDVYSTTITTTGDAACAPYECLYTIDTGTDPATYDEFDCGNNPAAGPLARCYQYNESSVNIVIMEVSMWS